MKRQQQQQQHNTTKMTTNEFFWPNKNDFLFFLESDHLNKERLIFLDTGMEAVAGCEWDF